MTGIQYLSISKKACSEVIEYCKNNNITDPDEVIALMREKYPFGKKDHRAYDVYVHEIERSLKRLLGDKYYQELLTEKGEY